MINLVVENLSLSGISWIECYNTLFYSFRHFEMSSIDVGLARN
jgi:hypothetical protein